MRGLIHTLEQTAGTRLKACDVGVTGDFFVHSKQAVPNAAARLKKAFPQLKVREEGGFINLTFSNDMWRTALADVVAYESMLAVLPEVKDVSREHLYTAMWRAFGGQDANVPYVEPFTQMVQPLHTAEDVACAAVAAGLVPPHVQTACDVAPLQEVDDKNPLFVWMSAHAYMKRTCELFGAHSLADADENISTFDALSIDGKEWLKLVSLFYNTKTYALSEQRLDVLLGYATKLAGVSKSCYNSTRFLDEEDWPKAMAWYALSAATQRALCVVIEGCGLQAPAHI